MTLDGVPLGSVARISRNGIAPGDIATGTRYVGLESISAGSGSLNWATVDNGDIASTKFAFSKHDVLFGKLRPYLCKVARPDFAGVCSTDILPITPFERLDRGYLYQWLRTDAVIKRATLMATGANLPRISPATLLSFKIPLPPLDEQRRIAAILDQADDLRQQRGKAIAVAEEIAGVAYRNLVMNDEALPVVAIADLATYMRTGPFGSQLLHSEFTETGISVLGIDNAVNNRFQWDGLRYIPESKFRQLKRFEVFPGDVIITIMGTLGRVAVVPSGIPRSISTKHLCSITLDVNRCLPEWLMGSLLYDASVRAQLGARERGAVMPGLNMQLIKSTRIKVPPMAVQARFSAVVMSVDRLLGTQRAHRVGLDDLFASLQHKFFARADEGALVTV